MSIKPLMEQGHPKEALLDPKKSRVEQSSSTEALTICTLAIKDVGREAIDNEKSTTINDEHSRYNVRIECDKSELTWQRLFELLREYKGVFAFGPDDMPNIDSMVIKHHLNVDPIYKPIV